MAGIFTRNALDKIMQNAELTPEQRTEQVFSLYGRALDEGFVSKHDAEEARNAAVEAAKAGFKAPEPVDVKTTAEYQELARERDMLRAIGGEEFQSVKPKFREQVFGMLDRGDKAKPVADQLAGIAERYEEYFTPKPQEHQQPKPTFGAPTQGSMPTGNESAVAAISNAWGFVPKK